MSLIYTSLAAGSLIYVLAVSKSIPRKEVITNETPLWLYHHVSRFARMFNYHGAKRRPKGR